MLPYRGIATKTITYLLTDVEESCAKKAKDYWGTGHLLLIRDFYGYVERKEKFPIEVEEAYRAVKLIGALYRSNGTRIEL